MIWGERAGGCCEGEDGSHDDEHQLFAILNSGQTSSRWYYGPDLQTALRPSVSAAYPRFDDEHVESTPFWNTLTKCELADDTSYICSSLRESLQVRRKRFSSVESVLKHSHHRLPGCTCSTSVKIVVS